MKLVKRLFLLVLSLVIIWEFMPGMQAQEPPVVANDSAVAGDSLPRLSSILLAEPLQVAPKVDSAGILRLPPVPRGFFCKFEDKMQQKWKIPLNLELK